MKTAIRALLAVFLSTASMLAQGTNTAPALPPPPPPPAPAMENATRVAPPITPFSTGPSRSPIQDTESDESARATPTIAPLHRALSDEEKSRAADELFAHKTATLVRTTSVTASERDTYSAQADFTITGKKVAIKCSSPTRAAVEAFFEYTKQLFAGDGSTKDLSLDMIVAGARNDVAKRHGLAEAAITVTYVDQFNKTHVLPVALR